MKSLLIAAASAVTVCAQVNLQAANEDFFSASAFDTVPSMLAMTTLPPPSSIIATEGPPGVDRVVYEVQAGGGGGRMRNRQLRKMGGGDNDVKHGRKLQGGNGASTTMTDPIITFDGPSNYDNVNRLNGLRPLGVNPPDPVGAVGRQHYVAMTNLLWAVYNKSTGETIVEPTNIGNLWAGFEISDCAIPAGDPVALYDSSTQRWILMQFTTRGPTFWTCIAVSQTEDPAGAYYRYAFYNENWFPDYPKISLWTDSVLMTTRDFENYPVSTAYGISVWALEKAKMIAGDPNARGVKFLLDCNDGPESVPLHLCGDGLLPADIDGKRRPIGRAPAVFVGTADASPGYTNYGAPYDGMTIFELDVQWNARAEASFRFITLLPVADFTSAFPCVPERSRNCLPQPGSPIRLDILSYRQRPTFRLAYRNFGTYESFVTSQSVNALDRGLPGLAGMRWYELRRTRTGNGNSPNSGYAYTMHQQGTYALPDGVHRWMGSAAQDGAGNIALAYQVTNAQVWPGIRYTGRTPGEPLNTMGVELGEKTLQIGTIGSPLSTTNSRWGDYTALNVDPNDDCTFWYIGQYLRRQPPVLIPAPWATRIGSFRLPACRPAV